MNEEKNVSDFVKFMSLNFPKNPKAYVRILNENRTYELLGLMEVEKGFATPHTLGNRIELYSLMTDVQCVEFLDKYANKFWKGEKEKPAPFPYAELAPYPILMNLVTQKDIFSKLKGNELLTRTVITRKDGKTTMGIDPLIDNNAVIASENEIEVEDLDGLSGLSGKELDQNYWSITEWKAKTSGYLSSNVPVHFHNPPKDYKLEKTIPKVLLTEEDTIHVFSDSPLNRTSYITKFPLVRRLK